VLDDYHSFIEDESVYIKDFSPTSLISLSNTKFGWGRWIPMMTFALDNRLGGGEIFYFHLTNFTIHILCTLAVIFLVTQLLKSNKEEDPTLRCTSSVYCAIWVAGLWALNPVQTNAVTYLVQRMASIQTFFYVLGVSFYILGRRKHLFCNNKLGALFFYLATFIATICAFLSKQNAAMLPVMLVVTEVWVFQSQLFRPLWTRIRKTNKVVWSILLFNLFLSILLSVKIFNVLDGGYAIRNFSMWERLLTESRVIVWYLTILLWPLPSRLSIEHDIEISTSFLSPPTTLLSFLFLFLMLYLALKYRRKFPLLSYGGMWFFLNLAIESTIVSLELVFEHRLYLPSIGFYLFIVLALVGIFRTLLGNMTKRDFIRLAWSGFAIVASCYCLLTFQRNEAWRDFLTFNQDVVSKAPLNSRAHSNLAVALAKAQKYEEAIQEAEIAIKLGYKYNEQYVVSASVIVGASIGLGNFEKAAEYGEKLLANRPEPCDAGALPNFCLQIAEAYRRMGQLGKACSYALLGMEYHKKIGAGPSYEKKLIEGMLFSILTETKDKDVDLDGDGLLDPGSLPIRTWIALAF
jgi:tetratricopeptide (TPR) repeat protein